MKLTLEQTEKISSILESYGSMFIGEQQECKELIYAIKGGSQIKNPLKEIDEIINRASRATGVPVEEMMKKSRKRHIVMARSYAIYQVYERIYMKVGGLSLERFGNIFGGMHHASIISAHRRIRNWLKYGDAETTEIHDNFVNGVEIKIAA